MPRAQATDRDVGRQSNAGSNCREAQKRPTIPLHFLHCTWTCRCREAQDVRERPSMEVGRRKVRLRGGRTTAWMEEHVGNSGRGAVAEIELRREQQPRAMQATCRARMVTNNPFAFPPSVAVRCRKLEQRTTPWMEEVEPRREQRSRSGCRGRVAPGAATESNAGSTTTWM